MSNKLIALLLIPAILLVLFTHMPTGSSAADVVAGYNETNTYSASSASYMNYLTATQTNENANDSAARAYGNQIAAKAIELCEVYGYGYGGGDWQTNHAGISPAGRINRNGPWPSTYGGIQAQINAANVDIHLQCAGFASYCWVSVLNTDAPINQTVGNLLGVWEVHALLTTGGTNAAGNYEYIISNANPGDLIFFIDEDFRSGDDWPLTRPAITYEQAINNAGNCSPWAHVEVYLGEGMIAGSNSTSEVWKQAYIKELSTTRQMWLLKVDDAGVKVANYSS